MVSLPFPAAVQFHIPPEGGPGQKPGSSAYGAEIMEGRHRGETDPFYLTAKWQHLRKRILRRDGYVDQWAKRYNPMPKQATMVHHIFPREWFPEWQWDPWNLISLSLTSHNELHDRNSGRLTSKGLQLLRLTAEKRGMSAKEIQELVRKMDDTPPG